MSNSLEFKISAEDQASRVVETVQKKIQNFGHDIAKMALGFVGPMAIAQFAIQKLTDYLEEQKAKRESIQKDLTAMADKEAQENAHRYATKKKEIDSEIASIEARAAAKRKENQEDKDRPEKLRQAAADYLSSVPEGKSLVEEERKRQIKEKIDNYNKQKEISKKEGYLNFSGSTYLNFEKIYSNESSTKRIIEELSNLKSIQDKVRESNINQNALSDAAEQKRIAGLHELANSLKAVNAEFEKQEKLRIKELALTERINKAQLALIEAKSRNRETMTVSSLRESGGGIAGETAAIKAQQNQTLQTPEQLQAVQNAQTWLESAKMMKETVMDFDKAVSKMSETTSVPNVFNTPGIYTGSMDGN